MKNKAMQLPFFLTVLLSAYPPGVLADNAEFRMKVQYNSPSVNVYLYLRDDVSTPFRQANIDTSGDPNFHCDIGDDDTAQPSWDPIAYGTNYFLRVENRYVALRIDDAPPKTDFKLWFDGSDFSVVYNPNGIAHLETATLDWNGQSQAVVVDQELEGSGVSVDSIGHWQGGSRFTTYIVPKQFTFIRGSFEVLRGAQKMISLQKYRNWTLDDTVVNHRLFAMQSSFPALLTSQFKPVAPLVTIKTQLLDAPETSGGSIQFRDPWYIDFQEEGELGNSWRNRGMAAALYRDRSVGANGFKPDTTTVYNGSPYPYNGVFLNQNPNWLPDQPNYFVGTPATQEIGDQLWWFLNWAGDAQSVSFQNSSACTTGVVFKQAGATVTAIYKGHLRSSNSAATASNSQRKIGYINATYHMVYESAGEIWHCSSTDNGASWSQEFLVSDGSGTSRQPSLAVSQYWSSGGPVVVIAWESSSDNYSNIYVRGRYNDGSWSGANLIWSELCDAGFEGATPAIAMEDSFQVVAWRAKRTDGWGTPGIYFWLNSDGNSYLVEGTDQYSQHPSVAVPAFQTSKGRFGVAWSQGGEIYYKRFWYDFDREDLFSYSTECPSEGSSLVNHDYPSLVFINSYGLYPAVAWQGSHHVTYLSSVLVRRRTGSGWGTIQQYSQGGGDEFYQPSLTRHEHPDTSLAMVWHDYSSLYLAKCTSSWGSRIDLTDGVCPSLGFDVTGNNSNFRILYTDPSTSPATIASTNESLPKSNASGPEILMRELTGEKSGVLRSVIVKNLSIKDEHSESTILFGPITDTHAIRSRSEGEGYLTTEPVTIAAGQTVELTVQSSVQRKYKAAVPSAAQIQLLVRDASTGATLLSAVLDSLSGPDSSVSVRSYALPAGELAGKTVRLSVLPVDGDTASGKWAATIIHCDTTGVKKESSPEVLLRPAASACPERFRFYEAYPNPFNPSTTLKFDLPSDGMVLLQVYNMLGQQVAELVKEYRTPGTYTVTWTASGQASGTYLAQFTLLDAMGNSKVRQVVKLILVK